MESHFFVERKSKTDLHGPPMWFFWLRHIIKCLRVTFFLLQACLSEIYLFCMIRGLLKIVSSRGWFSIRLQFAINVFLRSYTTGWYVVMKGNSLSLLFSFCFRANCLWSELTSDNGLSVSCLGYPRALRHCLNFARHSSNIVFEEFVCSNLIARPLMKPLGWHEAKCVYWKVSVSL